MRAGLLLLPKRLLTRGPRTDSSGFFMSKIMCQVRRQDKYKAKHICISCQKQFKDSGNYSDGVRRNEARPCPHCGSEMREVSRDFRVPRMNDKRRWDAIREMLSDSETVPFHNHSCGCYSGRVINQSVNQRKRYVDMQKEKVFDGLKKKLSIELTKLEGKRTHAWKYKEGNNTRYGRC